jgi:hypothetical protein
MFLTKKAKNAYRKPLKLRTVKYKNETNVSLTTETPSIEETINEEDIEVVKEKKKKKNNKD